MKKIVIIGLSALLLSAGCRQENGLEGRWSWVKSKFISRGLSRPQITTPKTRGYTIELIIGATEIEIIKNQKSEGSVTYLRYQQPESEFDILRVAIPADDFPFYISSGPIYFKGDTLIIAGTYNDAGEDQYYLRTAD